MSAELGDYESKKKKKEDLWIPNITQIPEEGGQDPTCGTFPEFGIFG